MLVLNRAQVEALTRCGHADRRPAQSDGDLSAGKASVPNRVKAHAGHGGLAAMPGNVPSTETLMCRLYTHFPGNTGGTTVGSRGC